MKQGTAEKRKFKRLKRRLGLKRYEAVGLLESLWDLTRRETPAGNVGRLTDADIADEMEWEGEPADLIVALVDEGWLDRHDEHRLIVHDWSDHAPNYLKALFKRENRQFADAETNSVATECETESPQNENLVLPQSNTTSPNPNPPHALTKPHPTSAGGGEVSSPGKGGVERAGGGADDARLDRAARSMRITNLLRGADVSDHASILQIAQRRDMTPEIVESVIADVRGSPDIDSPPAVIVARLLQGRSQADGSWRIRPKKNGRNRR